MAWKLQDLFTGILLVSVIAYTEYAVKGLLLDSPIWPFDGVAAPEKPITHILLVSFRLAASQDMVDAICKRIIAFKETCLDAKGKPYILATSGGANNNPEDSNKDMTHGFIIEFKNDADRRYFLDVDQAHKDFVEHISPINRDFLTLDFTPGVYQPSDPPRFTRHAWSPLPMSGQRHRE